MEGAYGENKTENILNFGTPTSILEGVCGRGVKALAFKISYRTRRRFSLILCQDYPASIVVQALVAIRDQGCSSQKTLHENHWKSRAFHQCDGKVKVGQLRQWTNRQSSTLNTAMLLDKILFLCYRTTDLYYSFSARSREVKITDFCMVTFTINTHCSSKNR